MSPTRNHPARSALEASASGHPPTRTELDAIAAEVTGGMRKEDAAKWRSALELACHGAARLRNDGANAEARAQARQNAEQLCDLLVDEWSPGAADDEPFDAQKIADSIPR